MPGSEISPENIKLSGSLSASADGFKGVPIRQAGSWPLEIDLFLPLAVSIVQSLSELHAQKITCALVNPDNILLDRQTGDIRFANPNEAGTASATLLYISPEQTGRMNRASDYRSGLYSLGIVFYEMLTGQLPFPGPDPAEIVYAHIAKQPAPPDQLVPELPPVLSDIIMKLLAKAAEDRYQSASGLKADLVRCHQQWTHQGRIDSFVPGLKDISELLLIPQKLYGREADLIRLMSSFRRMIDSSRPEMVFVTGYSGIGKSALIHELYRPITQERGLFISGKFEQFRSAVPYASISAAFRELLQQILTENEEDIAGWRITFLQALGVNAQLMSDMIPYLELIIGKQPPVPDMPPAESQNRFQLVFKKFVSVFARKEHPLVVFLDDVQWIDSPSLRLLEYLAAQTDLSHLMFIGSYRDNEVGPEHPLTMTLKTWQENRVPLEIITLSPLSFDNVWEMARDTFPASRSSTKQLAELLFGKTGGNPFFIIQFLKTLYEEGYISFDKEQMAWIWDAGLINSRGYTDNVVELMVAKLRKLPESTQVMLMHAACIGSRFELATAAVVSIQSPDNARRALDYAVNEGLLLSTSEGYYQFLHDRIHQAAYALIPEDQLEALHLQIGRTLLEVTPPPKVNDMIFQIVYQLNLGLNRIESSEEKIGLARLNQRAGTQAIAALAYEPAYQFFKTGIQLLGSAAWSRHYELMLALHEGAAEAACLTGSFTECEQLISIVLEQAVSSIQKVKVFETQLEMYIAQGELSKTIGAGVEMLKLLGVVLPDKPVFEDFSTSLNRLWTQRLGELSEERIARLVDLPLMSDPESLAKMRILNALISPTFLSNPELMPLIAINMVDLSVQYGNCYASPFGYCSLGFILGTMAGDIENGYQFGRMAVELLNHIDATKTRARTIYLFNAFIRHTHDHLRDTIAGLDEANLLCMQTGDFEYAARSLTIVPRYLYWMGENLSRVEDLMKPSRRMVEQIKQQTSVTYIQIFQQAVANLIRSTGDHSLLTGEYCNEAEMMPLLEQTGNRHGIFLAAFNKLLLGYLFHDYPHALENALLAAATVNSSRGLFHFYKFFCYDSLARLAMYEESAPARQDEILERVAGNQEKLRLWSNFAPMNHLHRWHLVEAELARILGNDEKSLHHITLACSLAADSGYAHEEALAWELAAGLHHQFNRRKLAQSCLQAALAGYKKWGAQAKVRWMEEQYPSLKENRLPSAASASASPIAQLDMRSVVKASQALSSEIMLPRLVEILMQIVLEIAGAQKGVLLISSANVLSIYATATLDNNTVNVCVAADPEVQSVVLPVGIINYVSRSLETMILEDAAIHPMLAADEYVQNQRPHSVLCMPVVRQNQLMALLYLENNLVSGAFTMDILAILEIIASQAAISIENAILYSDLQASESRFRAIFEKSVQLIGLLTPNGILVAANDAALGMIGIDDPNLVIGQPFWETPWWSHSIELQERVRQAIQTAATGELVRYETAHPSVDGIIHYIDFSIKPVKNEHGETIMLIPEGRDITERKQFEKALAASEEKYRAIFDNTGTATIMIEEDTTISLVNSEFSRLMGYSRQEIEGKMSWTEFTRSPQREIMMEYHLGRRGNRKGIPSQYELEFYNRSGEIKQTLISVTMIPETGQSIAVIVDVSEQRRAEAEIIRLEKLLRSIIDSMPSVIVAVDSQSRVTQWNARAASVTGLTAEEAIGRPFKGLHPLSPAIDQPINLALTRGLVQKVEKLPFLRDERPSFAEVTIYPLTDEENRGAVIRIDDVTEKVKLDEAIIQTEKMMSVGGLAAGMAHEINNPLGGIIQGVQNVERRMDSALPANQATAEEIGLDLSLVSEYLARRQVNDLLNGIKNSGIRASTIVRNMLQFSRQPQTDRTRCRLEDLLERALELASSDYDLKKSYDFRHIEIIRQYDPDFTPISCSESEIEQVILNLLKNAAQAMHDVSNPGFKPRLLLRTYREQDLAVMDIADNGPGMDENIRRRIFEPFFTTKATGEGTGLGLSVSYFIITQNHSGQMSVDSSPGQGACFTIKLPLA